MGLLAEGAFEDGVADQTKGEDGGGEEVAAVTGVVVEDVGQGFVVVFLWHGGRMSEDCENYVGMGGRNDIPLRATMLGTHVSEGSCNGIESRGAHFQKRGLNTIVAADTGQGISNYFKGKQGIGTNDIESSVTDQ